MYPIWKVSSEIDNRTQSIRISEWTPLTLKNRSIAPEVIRILDNFSDDIPGITNRSQELVEFIMWHASWYLNKHDSPIISDAYSITDDIFTCTAKDLFVSIEKDSGKFIIDWLWDKQWRILRNLD